MSYDTIKLELKHDRRIAIITLNRPQKLNAINLKMRDEFESALDEVEKEKELWTLIVKGTGKAFSAGQDLTEVGIKQGMIFDPRDRWFLSELWEAERRALEFWQNLFYFPRYKIAQVHGHCLEWGCLMAMCCNYVIASEDAIFGDPSIRAGYASANPLWTWRVGPRKARELLFTGRSVPAREAADIGLATMVVARQDLDAAALEAAEVLRAGVAIGGYDFESATLAGFARSAYDIGGLAPAWDVAANLHALSAIQRRGFEPTEYNFFTALDRGTLKEAIAERDRPFQELGL